MKILTLHCDYIRFKPVKGAISKPPALSAEEKKGLEVKECLVVLSAVEKQDESAKDAIVKNLVGNVKDIAGQVKAKTIVLYPYVHLTSEPSSPDTALYVLKEAEKALNKEKFKTIRAPFGWYKQFELKCKGHPLAELSREIKAEKAEAKAEAEKIKEKPEEKEGKIKEIKIITSEGELLKEKDIRKRKISKNEIQVIENIVASESGKKKKIIEGEPAHLKLVKKLGITEQESVSDAGNPTFLPNGGFIRHLINDIAYEHLVNQLGAMPIRTPVIVRKDDPAVRWLSEKFPERHYKVVAGKEEKQIEMFLKTAGDYNVFSIFRNMSISYNNLPLALYENEINHRYEQRGELKGLHRLRHFEMHDVHAVCENKEQAQKFFKDVFNEICEVADEMTIKPDAFLFYCKSKIFDEYKNYLTELAKQYHVPVIILLLEKITVYMDAWIDFIVLDSLNRPIELATSQIDFISAKNWHIRFTDKNNKIKHPVIIHSGFGIERAIASLFEQIARHDIKHAILPFWLSPTQVRIIPISEKFIEQAKDMARDLNEVEPFTRADVDDRPLHVEKKILEAEQEWIPYTVCLGKRELDKRIIAVRSRVTGKIKEMKPVDFKNLMKKEQNNRPFRSLPFPVLVSKKPRFV